MLQRILLPVICAGLMVLQAGMPIPPVHGKKAFQPKIMVIPKIKTGQEMKAVYDSDLNIRVALVKIDEAFVKRGANIVSFDAKLKEVTQNMMINKVSGNQVDYRSMVIQQSGADIYVEAEVDVVKHSQRNANSVTILLEGYQTGTANLLGSKQGQSRMVQTDDIGYLTSQAMDSVSEGFLNLMQRKFDDIHDNGQSMYVQFSLGAGARINFDSEVGTPANMLSDLIDQWFQKNCVKAVYNNQGVAGNVLIISDARMPLRTAANQPFTGQTLWSELNKFLRGLGLQPKREIGNNNKLMITLQ
ncbi:MAG TPA: DUF6175 family protein [Puia sp.]|jgi:hypothetical protein